jgi:hypothetical protein
LNASPAAKTSEAEMPRTQVNDADAAFLAADRAEPS